MTKNTPHDLSLMASMNMIKGQETIEDVARRVSGIVNFEKHYGVTGNIIKKFREAIEELFLEGAITITSSGLINTQEEKYPLSACAVPPVDLRSSITHIKQIVEDFHAQGMGTGFNFDDLEDPVGMLNYLNDLSIQETKAGRTDRPVANMGSLSIYHPMILDFIKSKNNVDFGVWKFNISVNIDDAFMRALKTKKSVKLWDGTKIPAEKIFALITQNAYLHAEPGVIFGDRMQEDNPTPKLGQYKSYAPCAEVGLVPGETCQFGYLNLMSLLVNHEDGSKSINYRKASEMVEILTRYLDDCLDYSARKFNSGRAQHVVSHKRKIGIGVFGFADLLIALNIEYGSPESLSLAEDIMSHINLVSKKTSLKLAQDRGVFLDFKFSQHQQTPSFIQRRYAILKSGTTSSENWQDLDKEIKDKGLRNASTTALPPTGKSSLVLGRSAQIEPIFSLLDFYGNLRSDFLQALKPHCSSAGQIERFKSLFNELRSCQKITDIPLKVRSLFKTIFEISPLSQLEIVHAWQKWTDEGVSKTINLSRIAKPEIVDTIMQQSWEKGLKGMTVYRDGSKDNQPK